MKKFRLFLLVLYICLVFAVSSTSAFTLMEVYNENDYWSDGTWYATQVALKYVPVASYDLERVEFFTGGDKTNVTISLRPDSSDYPSPSILASGTYDSSSSGDWLGATFSTPYSIMAGTPYWVTWYFTDGLEAPYSEGITRTVRWGEGYNPDYYPNLYEASGFKTKFYGETENPPIPEPSTLNLPAPWFRACWSRASKEEI